MIMSKGKSSTIKSFCIYVSTDIQICIGNDEEGRKQTNKKHMSIFYFRFSSHRVERVCQIVVFSVSH